MITHFYNAGQIVTRLLATLVVGLFCIVTGNAQPYPDSQGTDFWFTFLPNFHNDYDSLDTRPDKKLEHEIYIYISANTATSGTITLKNRQGQTRVEPFTIADPSQIYEFRTYFKPYELLGFNRSGAIDYVGMQTESVAEQSVYITTDHPVTVYALNQASLTSDAFLVLPTDALAEDYIVTAYTSDIEYSQFGSQVPASSSTPSQFCVVATEDNTSVEIQPTASTFASPNQEAQIVTLNKGQSYLVQVDPRLERLSDLTGSVVRATKPIAVFGGHQRAVVPIENKNQLGSRDCLIEQMNPIRTWGRSAFVFPLAPSQDEMNVGSNKFRVVAAFDSTEVFVSDLPVALLNRGQFYEGALDQAAEVRSSKSTMVAMLKKTTGSGSVVNGSRVGDPFMMLVPPAEQFMKSYRFTNVQANTYTYNPFNGSVTKGPVVYVEQYLAVVITSEGLPSLVLDGANIGDARFQQIPNTSFYWATIRMQDGIHEITSDTTFGIYVYGYGVANSYGYIGGMAFRPLDVQPPTINGITQCGLFTGTITDSVIGDTRIKTAQVVSGSEVNVAATIAPFDPPARIVAFTAMLSNPFDDGTFTVEAADNARQTASKTIDVPGFTIGSKGQGANNPPTILSKVVAQHLYSCDTLVIENYGKFPQSITAVRTVRGATVTTPPLPITLNPGQQVSVEVCQLYDSSGIFYDTLVVENACITRATHTLFIDVRADEIPPYTTLEAPPCSLEYVATVGDDRDFDYGLLTSTILNDVLVNCTVEETNRTAFVAKYKVIVTDPLYDAIYGFASTDSAGNSVEYRDTIPGFTLSFEGIGSGYVNSVGLRSQQVGEMLCDTVWLTNYGSFTQVVNQAYVHINQEFSLPQHQFPITIEPGMRKPLTVCYQPRQVSDTADLDTIDFSNGCLVKNLEVSCMAIPSTFQGLSRCDVRIQSQQFALGGRLLVAPNPATDIVTFILDQSTESLQVRVLTLQGALARTKSWSGQTTNTFQLDVSDLPSGTYIVVARYGSYQKSAVISVH